MKTSLIIKSLLLIIPLIVIRLIFLHEEGSSSGIGGGSYNLAKLYYAIFAVGFLIIYEIILLINGKPENTVLHIIALLLLIGHIIYGLSIFN